MFVQKRFLFILVSMMGLVLLISACSSSVGGASASSLSPLQVLQKSADAMKQLKSSHVVLQTTSNIQTNGSATTTNTPVAGVSGPMNVNLSLKGDGDQKLPDQEQLNLTINNSLQMSEILQGDKVYVKNALGQWYVMDKNTLQGIVGNPFSGLNIDQNSLLGILQSIKITDHGTQSLNGQNLRHITAELDKDALRQLLSNNPQLKSALGTQDVDTALNDAKSFLSTVDVWIDETDFYVHRTELKINLDANTSAVGNGVPSNVKTAFDTILDLSKFNESVTITPPTNATSTSNPASIIGFGNLP